MRKKIYLKNIKTICCWSKLENDETIDKLFQILKKSYPKAKFSIVGAEWNQIKGKKCDILFVAFGSPKQEKWIAKYSEELKRNILGVGEAFDWLSGAVRKPPRWINFTAWMHQSSI